MENEAVEKIIYIKSIRMENEAVIFSIKTC